MGAYLSESVVHVQRGGLAPRVHHNQNTGIHLTEKGLDLLEQYVSEVRSVIGYEIPLAVEEQQGVAGRRQVTSGVPLLAGQAQDVKDLRLVARDAAGKTVPVPAQFRDLADQILEFLKPNFPEGYV